MCGTMLRFTVGKLRRCPNGFDQLPSCISRISWKRQVCMNASSEVLVLPVYRGRAMSQLSCFRTGGLFVPRFVWKHSRHTVAFYSTSTDSNQTSPVDQQDSKNSLRVPSDDVKKLLNLAYPQRLRLSGKSSLLHSRDFQTCS